MSVSKYRAGVGRLVVRDTREEEIPARERRLFKGILILVSPASLLLNAVL